MKYLLTMVVIALVCVGSAYAGARQFAVLHVGDNAVTSDYKVVCAVTSVRGLMGITCGRAHNTSTGYIATVTSIGVTVSRNGKRAFIGMNAGPPR